MDPVSKIIIPFSWPHLPWLRRCSNELGASRGGAGVQRISSVLRRSGTSFSLRVERRLHRDNGWAILHRVHRRRPRHVVLRHCLRAERDGRAAPGCVLYGLAASATNIGAAITFSALVWYLGLGIAAK